MHRYCTCPAGCSGVFCKHQVTVKDAFNVYFKPTFPTLDASDKELYYYIASGRTNVPEGFYGLSEGNNKQQLKQSIIAEDVSEPGKISNAIAEDVASYEDISATDINLRKTKDMFIDKIDSFIESGNKSANTF